jgi:peroxiredoxin-like protein
LPHYYDAHLSGGPSGYAQVFVGGVPELSTAPPKEFDGPGDAWSPEHLLLAAIETCFLFTLRTVARLSNVEFTRTEVDAAGTVDRRDRVTRFTEIVLRAKVTVPAGSNQERARHAIEKAERNCLISASLAVPVRLEVEIDEALPVVDQVSPAHINSDTSVSVSTR